MKKSILIVTPELKKCGLTEIFVKIVTNLEDIEFEVAAEFNGDRCGLPEFVPVIGLPRQSDVIRYMKAISKVVREGDYDKVYIHANSAMMIVETLAARLGGGREIITHCHNSSSAHKISHHILKPIFNIMVDRKIGCCDTSSKWAYRGSNIYTIANGVDVDKFRFDADKRTQTRRRLGIETGEVLIGHVARLVAEKNQIFLLDIFTEYLKKEVNARMIIVGEGELRDEVQNGILSRGLGDNVTILQPTDDIVSLYNAMDAIVMPSIYEGLNLVALEAQANGLPVIISDHLTPETYVSEYAVAESVYHNAETWAGTIANAIDRLERGGDTHAVFEEHHLTESDMLHSIHEILSE